MSEFGGPVFEFPFISIDRFDKENLQSTVYLLSHCHADHMVGLGDPAFFERLKLKRLNLFCHRLSAGLLRALPQYEQLLPHVIPLETDLPVTIEVCDQLGNFKYTCTLTLISAGHCPGSVMFLLNTSHVSVLFTGDFRFDIGQGNRMKLSNELVPLNDLCLDNVYVDTTFCREGLDFIPSRESCLSVIFDTVERWLASGSSKNVVHFQNRTRYGYEFLMKELAERFNTKIHVNIQQFELYNFVPSIQKFLTVEPSLTFLHFCKSFCGFDANLKLPCQHSLNFMPQVLTIIPTAMFFTKGESMPSQLVKAISERTIRCCYSTHSSTEEIVDFLSCLNFKALTPFVRPDKETTIDSVKMLLYRKLRQIKGKELVEGPSNEAEDSAGNLWSDKISFSKISGVKRNLNDENLAPTVNTEYEDKVPSKVVFEEDEMKVTESESVKESESEPSTTTTFDSESLINLLNLI